MRIAVVGAGPIGIEFATAAVAKGHTVTAIEKGDTVASNVVRWGHVQAFSPWELNTSAEGRALLDAPLPPAETFPTGAELWRCYLQPLAQKLQPQWELLLDTTVLSIGKSMKLKTEGLGGARRATKFRLLVSEKGNERYIEGFDAVVDCSGTFGNPNWLGPGGLPAIGERSLAASADPRLVRHLPDPLGKDRTEYSGKTTAVVGSGYSAVTTVIALRALAREAPGTKVIWLLRRRDYGSDASSPENGGSVKKGPYKRIEGDPLPQRDALAALGNAIAASALNNDEKIGEERNDEKEAVEVHVGATVEQLRPLDDGRRLEVRVKLASGGKEGEEAASANGGSVGSASGASAEEVSLVVDRLVGQVGFRPDTSIYSELQVHQCYATEGPMKLAMALMASSGASFGDCLAQVVPDADTLITSEPNFFVLGMKSYGRGSQFLLRVGHEQVQHVLELLDSAAQSQK